MNRKLIYPIICINIPEPLYRLLCNFGVPVTKSISNQIYSNIIIGDAQKPSSDHDETQAYTPIRISWQSLLKNLCNPEDLDPQSHKTVKCQWAENTIRLTENIIRETIAREVISRLRHTIINHGLPWVQLAPYPEGYSGVFNFRIDIDEPEPHDWQSVIQALSPIERSVTWFLSTRATQKAPQIYDWLKGHDVQSHGHWHHVHSNDWKLNRLNLQLAHDELVSHGFNPNGYAAPCGKFTEDLPGELRSMNYHFLAGIGDLCGSTPQLSSDGVWRIHALPVSEGLYLESNIDDIDSVVNGYIAIAERAIHNDRPLFWYGHAERRLGRRPQILTSLVNYVLQKHGLWHVNIGEYLTWLDGRSKIQFEVFQSEKDQNRFHIQWNKNELHESPMVWLENSRYRWSLPLWNGQGASPFALHPENAQVLMQPVRSPEVKLLPYSGGWKSDLKRKLDWERETPVEFLRKGPIKRRFKGFLRSWTDHSWHERFIPKAWTLESSTDRISA